MKDMLRMKDLVGRMIASSIVNLFFNQPDIFNYKKANITEWNLAHHLANEIKKYIFWLDDDFDLSKEIKESDCKCKIKKTKTKRPDIVFHKRGINSLNFLIVELKRNIKKIEDDIQKIKECWLPCFNYRFGASVVIKSKDDWEIRLFERDKNNEELIESSSFGDYLPLPSNESISGEIKNLVNKITKTEKQDKLLRFFTYLILSVLTKEQDKTKKQYENEKKIEELVCKLYGLTK